MNNAIMVLLGKGLTYILLYIITVDEIVGYTDIYSLVCLFRAANDWPFINVDILRIRRSVFGHKIELISIINSFI